MPAKILNFVGFITEQAHYFVVSIKKFLAASIAVCNTAYVITILYFYICLAIKTVSHNKIVNTNLILSCSKI